MKRFQYKSWFKELPCLLMKKKSTVTIAVLTGPDCLPILIAKHCGLFEKFGVDLLVKPVLGYSSMKSCFEAREVDLIQMDRYVVPRYLGKDDEMASSFLIQGAKNGIILSGRMVRAGVMNRESLVMALKKAGPERPLRVAVPCLPGSQSVFLREFLKSANIAMANIEIVPMPYYLMSGCMKRNHVDICCTSQAQSWVQDFAGEEGGAVISVPELEPARVETAILALPEYVERYRDVFQGITSGLRELSERCSTKKKIEKIILELREQWPEVVRFSGTPEPEDLCFDNPPTSGESSAPQFIGAKS